MTIADRLRDAPSMGDSDLELLKRALANLVDDVLDAIAYWLALTLARLVRA